VIDREVQDPQETPLLRSDAPEPLHSLRRDLDNLGDRHSGRSLAEIYHDILHAMADVHAQFAHGMLSLTDRAHAETLYKTCCRSLQQQLSSANRAHREIIDELNEKLAEKLFVNFSLFQSLPDVWGIDQIFPIMPINGLHRPLDRRAVIQDITCDSDGRIDRYVDGQGIETTLPLPADVPGEPMLMGFFMTGAYQEILGDMHNLFGDTHSVDVQCNADGGYTISDPIQGDTVSKVLQYVNFEPAALIEAYEKKFTGTEFDRATRDKLLAELAGGLSGYTYLEE
jgi:arginine decarboxylase